MKYIRGQILFVGTETTYGQGAALTGSTHNIQMAPGDRPTFTIDYSYDGDRQIGQYSRGRLRRAQPSGLTTEADINIEAKGLGSAYSLTAVPPDVHYLLLGSGYSGSFQSSGWTYKPTSVATNSNSVGIRAYQRGTVLNVSGAYGSLTLGADGLGPTVFGFKVMGVASVLTDDSSPPARTWTAASIIPPSNISGSIVIGSYSNAVVRSWRYDDGKTYQPRTDINGTTATGMAGFAEGNRSPSLTMTIEEPALSAYDPFAAFHSGSVADITITTGNTALNKVRLSLNDCQITSISKTEDDNLATLDITFTPSVSAPDQNDDVTIEFI